MKVYVASDHAGFELKGALVQFLGDEGFEVSDLGPHELTPGDDYPLTIEPLAQTVASEPGSFGIAIGGSGQGEAMAANRIQGARAAEFYGGPHEALLLSRRHNDANILALGARLISPEEAKQAVLAWLREPFSGDERHSRRIQELG